MHISDVRMWSLIHIPTGPTMCLNPTALTVISRFDKARGFKCSCRLLPVLGLLQGPMLSPNLPSGAGAQSTWSSGRGLPSRHPTSRSA